MTSFIPGAWNLYGAKTARYDTIYANLFFLGRKTSVVKGKGIKFTITRVSSCEFLLYRSE